jgi:uncharacterized protein DUF6622
MLLEILKHTPVWVWGIFAALLYLGYFQSRPHTLVKRRVAILPVIFIGLSVFGVWSAFGVSLTALAGWASGMALALLLNRRLKFPRTVHYDPVSGRFSLPGSYGPFILMMMIFSTRYAVAVTMAIDHSIASSMLFALAVSLVYGLLSGAFLARSLRIFAATREQDCVGPGVIGVDPNMVGKGWSLRN